MQKCNLFFDKESATKTQILLKRYFFCQSFVLLDNILHLFTINLTAGSFTISRVKVF